MRRWIALALALSCGDPQPKSSPVKERSTASRAEKILPSRDTVEIIAVAGAPTRAQLRDEMMGIERFVEPADLLRSLDVAQQHLKTFTETTRAPAESSQLLGATSTHEVRSHDLRKLVTQTLAAMEASEAGSSGKFYTATDNMSYPRIVALWQLADMHKVLRISDNNDNRAVALYIGAGEFSAEEHGLRELTPLAPGLSLLDAAPFLKDTKTIYPHIEEYHLASERTTHH